MIGRERDSVKEIAHLRMVVVKYLFESEELYNTTYP